VNTSQRNIVRVGCFVLAALAVLAGLSSGDIPGVLAGITGAVAFVVVGKLVGPGSTKVRPTEPRSPSTDGPEIVSVITCVDCGTKNRGDAYNCIQCGALMRSRRGAGSPK
jgi:hypothetical protein